MVFLLVLIFTWFNYWPRHSGVSPLHEAEMASKVANEKKMLSGGFPSKTIVEQAGNKEVQNNGYVPKYPIELSTECETQIETAQQRVIEIVNNQLTGEELDEWIMLAGNNEFRTVEPEESKSDEYKQKQFELNKKSITLLSEKYTESKDEMIGIMYLEECSLLPDSSYCNQSMVDAIFEHHGDNGYIWFYTPLWQGDNDKSEIIKKIITSSGISNYRNAHIKKIYQLLVDFGAEPFPSLVAAYGVSAAKRFIAYSPIFEYCEGSDYPDICLKLGEFMESFGRDALVQKLGLSLQERYWGGKDESKKAVIKVRQEALMASYRSQYRYPVFIMDDGMIQSHLIALDYDNEFEHATFINKESKRILSNESGLCAF